MRILLCCLFTAVLSGCQHGQSMFQMNSDSGAPFLGLQLSVDATNSQSASDGAQRFDIDSSPENLVADRKLKKSLQPEIHLTSLRSSASRQLGTDSRSPGVSRSPGELCISLPDSDADIGSEEANGWIVESLSAF